MTLSSLSKKQAQFSYCFISANNSQALVIL